MAEPYIAAWAAQFGALLRDKVAKMVDAYLITELVPLAHQFEDPQGGTVYQILCDEDAQFWLRNMDDEESDPILLDLTSLGVRP